MDVAGSSSDDERHTDGVDDAEGRRDAIVDAVEIRLAEFESEDRTDETVRFCSLLSC